MTLMRLPRIVHHQRVLALNTTRWHGRTGRGAFRTQISDKIPLTRNTHWIIRRAAIWTA